MPYYENGTFPPGGLDELLMQSQNAKMYFLSLPDYIQGMIEQRGGSIQSESELRCYAENLMAGDK